MKVSQGFQVADSTNLPKVDILMFLDYMIENDCYNVAEARIAKKLLRSQEDYVDKAIGYVEIKRKYNICSVRCRTSEHKVKAKLCMVTAVINETAEEIIKVECLNCESSAGGCKHAIWFTMWLIKRSEQPCMSTKCYWHNPKLAEVIADQDLLIIRNIGKRSRKGGNVEMKNEFATESKQSKMTMGEYVEVKNEFATESKESKMTTGENVEVKNEFVTESKQRKMTTGGNVEVKNEFVTESMNGFKIL